MIVQPGTSYQIHFKFLKAFQYLQQYRDWTAGLQAMNNAMLLTLNPLESRVLYTPPVAKEIALGSRSSIVIHGNGARIVGLVVNKIKVAPVGGWV